MTKMAKYNVHGGHAAYGKPYCGASCLIDESKEDRLVKDALIKYLKSGGATVYDCTVDTGTSQRNVLEKICTKCNKHSVDLDISIHFNSGRNDKKGDGKQGGFEIYATKYDSEKKAVAERMVANMKKLGFDTHGNPYKTTSSLYYLNHTNSKAVLLEVSFVDDFDDVKQYKKVGADAIGKALAEAILNKTVTSVSSTTSSTATTSSATTSSTSTTKTITATVNTSSSSLTVRNSKGSSIGSLKKGKTVKVVKKSATKMAIGGKEYTMAKIQFNDGTGYVAQKYLKF
jgi:N-acetylmuramoyl-L-alanine amidase